MAVALNDEFPLVPRFFLSFFFFYLHFIEHFTTKVPRRGYVEINPRYVFYDVINSEMFGCPDAVTRARNTNVPINIF